MTTIPTPGKSPSRTLPSRSDPAECCARSISTKSMARPGSTMPQSSLRTRAVFPVAQQNGASAGASPSDDSMAIIHRMPSRCTPDPAGPYDALRLIEHGLDRLRVKWDDRVRGIATSGWPGRSFSPGTADSVTVLAASASEADAAATVAANAMDLPGHLALHRLPAEALNPDSGLRPRPVTRRVATLDAADRQAALAAGKAVASRLARAGRIAGAALHLQGQAAAVSSGPPMIQAA